MTHHVYTNMRQFANVNGLTEEFSQLGILPVLLMSSIFIIIFQVN